MQTEAGTPLTSSASRAPRRRTVLVLVLAAVWVGLDQATKIWAEAALTRGESRPFIGELLQLHLTYNSGAAFSLGTSMTEALTVLASILVVIMLVVATKVRTVPWAITLGLLLGGAVGNLIDRFFRDPGPFRGHVVDFLALPNFPVFNVADTGITVAAGLMILLSLLGHQLEGPTAEPAATEDDRR